MRAEIVAVIPALDCAGTIGPVVSGILDHVAAVIVYNDGSTDETADVARSAGATVVAGERNRGKGYAVRQGIAIALDMGPEAVLLLDGDGQHTPEDAPAFLAAWDERAGDLIIGARLADVRAIPPARYWTNYIGSRVLSWMTGFELEDSQSGYRLIDAALLGRLGLAADGYAIESEMLIKAARQGARVAHVRVRTIYNGEPSHFSPVADTIKISWQSVYYKVFDDVPSDAG